MSNCAYADSIKEVFVQLGNTLLLHYIFIVDLFNTSALHIVRFTSIPSTYPVYQVYATDIACNILIFCWS